MGRNRDVTELTHYNLKYMRTERTGFRVAPCYKKLIKLLVEKDKSAQWSKVSEADVVLEALIVYAKQQGVAIPD